MENNRGGAMKSYILIFGIMLISLAIASFWDKVPWIKNSVHSVLDPSFGSLLNWNITIGMLIIIGIISLLTTLVQKYLTDQNALKEIKTEQKAIKEEMKNFRDNPSKMMELNKKSLALMPRTMQLSMKSVIYTGVPFILLFRWFYDYFALIGNYKFFGFLTWFWFYLIFVILFSSILKKVLKVE